jgi:hypothetical protein
MIIYFTQVKRESKMSQVKALRMGMGAVGTRLVGVYDEAPGVVPPKTEAAC